MIVVRIALACLALSIAACASAPPPPDLSPPPRKPYDAKTQLETGRRY